MDTGLLLSSDLGCFAACAVFGAVRNCACEAGNSGFRKEGGSSDGLESDLFCGALKDLL